MADCHWAEAPPETGMTGKVWACLCEEEHLPDEHRCETHDRIMCERCHHCTAVHDHIQSNLDDSADELARVRLLIYPVGVCESPCRNLPEGLKTWAVCNHCMARAAPARQQARVKLN